MKRREFITLLGGAAVTWPLPLSAQQTGRMPRVGMLLANAENDPEIQTRLSAFRQRFAELGWTDGRNVRIDYLYASNDIARLRSKAAELLALGPDVIFAHSNPGLAALRQENRTIPTVFVQVADPVGSGFVHSLARPGGNATGFTNFEPSMGSKWVETLKEIAPGVARAGVLLHTETPANVAMFRAAEAAGPSFGVTVTAEGVRDATDIEQTINAFAGGPPGGGLIVLPHVVTAGHRELIARLALKHRLANVGAFGFMAKSGGLIAYGIDVVDLFRRSAAYVDRILRGTQPGDLPVQAPTKFELVINLKTAKTLGLEVPPQLLARADEVIE